MTTSNTSHFHRHTLISVWPQHKHSFASWAIPKHAIISHLALPLISEIPDQSKVKVGNCCSVFWSCSSLLYTLWKPHLKFTTVSLPEKEMAPHSSVLAWRIPRTAEPGGLPSMGSHRVGHDWSDLAAAAAALVFQKTVHHKYSIEKKS